MNKLLIIKLTTLLFTISFYTTGPVYGSQQFKKDGFSITLPDSWIEIPEKTLDEYIKIVSEQMPNVPKLNYEYAFQLKGSKNWFDYPYIIIIINNTGRPSKNELHNLNADNTQSVVEKYETDFDSMTSDRQIGNIYYDENRNILWMPLNMTVKNTGDISGLSGLTPTERGFIQVTGYAFTDKYSDYESTFMSIATSVIPETNLVYKPRWSDNLPSVVSGSNWGKIITSGITGVMLVLVFSAFSSLSNFIKGNKKKKQDNVTPED